MATSSLLTTVLDTHLAAASDMALTIQQMGYISPRREDVAAICVSAGIGDIPLHDADAIGGLYYCNVHTEKFPDGEICGQLVARE